MDLRAVSSAGRAPALQAGGRWFEPGTAHLWKAPLSRGFSVPGASPFPPRTVVSQVLVRFPGSDTSASRSRGRRLDRPNYPDDDPSWRLAVVQDHLSNGSIHKSSAHVGSSFSTRASSRSPSSRSTSSTSTPARSSCSRSSGQSARSCSGVQSPDEVGEPLLQALGLLDAIGRPARVAG